MKNPASKLGTAYCLRPEKNLEDILLCLRKKAYTKIRF
jgi:hypothetical protein